MKDKPGRMNVQRVETKDGSHIEPSFNEEWTLFDQLRWQAGVVHTDTGLDITVKPSDLRVNETPVEGYGDILLSGATALGPCTWRTAWAAMNGIIIGYRAAKREISGD